MLIRAFHGKVTQWRPHCSNEHKQNYI